MARGVGDMKDNDLRQGYIRLSNTSSCALDYYFRAAMASGASLKIRLKIEQNLATVNFRITARILAQA